MMIMAHRQMDRTHKEMMIPLNTHSSLEVERKGLLKAKEIVSSSSFQSPFPISRFCKIRGGVINENTPFEGKKESLSSLSSSSSSFRSPLSPPPISSRSSSSPTLLSSSASTAKRTQ